MTQSKISMPLISQSQELVLDDSVELDDFWNNKQLNFSVTDKTKIISYAQKIPTIDPLVFIQKFAQQNTLHFYWENPSKQEAVAAYGVARSTHAKSAERFKIARNFIHNCFQQIVRQGDDSLSTSKPCIFSSFGFFPSHKKNNAFSAATIFLPRFQIVKKNKNCCLIVNFPLKEAKDKTTVTKQIKQRIKQIDWTPLEQLNVQSLSNSSLVDRSQGKNSNYFKSVVASALDSIAMDEFSKIVIAHTTDIKSPHPFKLIESLNNLRQLHPDCYIFSTSNGAGQNFIGASPERLVSIQNQQLVTDALAGSAPRQ